MAAAPGRALAAAAGGPSGIDLGAMDRRVRPGDDFFRYALGNWLDHVQIPADQTEVGIDADTAAKVLQQLKDIVEADASQGRTAGGRIGALYRAFMDEARIEALDAGPLAADLARIAAVSATTDVTAMMGGSFSDYAAAAFFLLVTPDIRGSNYVLQVDQSGIGLPDRVYYLDPSFAGQLDAYRAYVARSLALVGAANPDEAARDIVALETRFAKASWPQEERRDIARLYNPMTVEALQAYAPGLNWRALLDAAGAVGVDSVIVAETTAVRDIARIYDETPLATLKAWETFHTIDNAAPYLSKRFSDKAFAFNGRVLGGIGEEPPRWKRAVAQVDASLGEALGREYVARHFSPDAKARMTEMVSHLKDAMAARIRRAAWMGATTRAEALAKLAKMQVFVGYPDRWRDYSGLEIDGDLYGDVKRSVALDWRYQLAMLGKPPPADEWGPFYRGIRPHTVDAFNIPNENKVIFPAAILQPPYFDPERDSAVNYGAIGAIIGHEITHGFDDQGRKIDADGQLRDWWASADAARFDSEAAKLAAQFDTYEALPGVHLNGKQTLGENIADLGGVLVALDAYHASLGGRPAPVLDGLTGDQRFFLGWALRWKRKQTDETLRSRAATDVHATAPFRAVGPLRNVDSWYEAFHVQPTDRYYLSPADRVRIW